MGRTWVIGSQLYPKEKHMPNTVTFNDPDTSKGLDSSPHGVYLIDPSTQKAITPAAAAAQTGYVAAYGSNVAALTANTDASFKWGASGTTQVNHVMLQNNTTINILWDLDVATSAGSPLLAPGQTIFFDVQTTALHIQANGTPNLNGTSSGNIVIRGWL
jgi:hypothetical protein